MSELDLGDFIHYSVRVVTAENKVAPDASVFVYNNETVDGSQADIWADPTKRTKLHQPLVPDSEGYVRFWAPTKTYNVTAWKRGYPMKQFTIDPHQLYEWCEGCETVRNKEDMADYLCRECRYGQ